MGKQKGIWKQMGHCRFSSISTREMFSVWHSITVLTWTRTLNCLPPNEISPQLNDASQICYFFQYRPCVYEYKMYETGNVKRRSNGNCLPDVN